ncbi:MAG: 2-amino-4-hydroxy-6-hydroxymethyldihydropteridine diphosphokinase [Xanthomonadales bacterium]|nr:2-amino-4-hydroxy-6-hydroxymethyldihydropteridine diphosphokinase [Xanthomonadales bacterium]
MTQRHQAVAYLSLGSNIEPEKNLCAAVVALRAHFGAVLLSPVYRTPAVGFAGADFLNAAARIHTKLDPTTLNDWLHALEARHGRRRDGVRFSSRTLDIDIVLYDTLVLSDDGHLEVPRTELATQAFVLKPMVDIAADVVHPVLGVSLHTLYERMDKTTVLSKVQLDCSTNSI